NAFGKSAAILFTTMPIMFYEMTGGVVLAPLFYFLVAAAALSSTISLLEVVVAYFIDNLGWDRRKSVLVVGGLIFVLGVFAALSNGAVDSLSGFFDIMDYTATNWLLPVGGLMISIFVGWILTNAVTVDELESGHGHFALHPVWKWALRVVCPLAIGVLIYAVLFQGVSFA
ncbi:MAG: sodium-dependent transporter, partial [Myxococcota bacterium]